MKLPRRPFFNSCFSLKLFKSQSRGSWWPCRKRTGCQFIRRHDLATSLYYTSHLYITVVVALVCSNETLSLVCWKKRYTLLYSMHLFHSCSPGSWRMIFFDRDPSMITEVQEASVWYLHGLATEACCETRMQSHRSGLSCIWKQSLSSKVSGARDNMDHHVCVYTPWQSKTVQYILTFSFNLQEKAIGRKGQADSTRH